MRLPGGCVQPKLLALDLDGTLCDADGAVPERLASVLAEWHATGARIVVATARAPRRALPIARKLGIDDVVICASGALVVEKDGREQACHRLEDAVVSELIAFAGRRTSVGLGAEVGHDLVATENFAAIADRLAPDGWTPLERPVTARALGGTHHVVACDERYEVAALAVELREQFGKQVEVVEQPDVVELYGYGISKLAGLQRLCAQWQIGAEAVLAAGDGIADASMLAWAGDSIAPGDAHPRAKTAARRIARGHGPAGVVEQLEAVLDSWSATSCETGWARRRNGQPVLG